MNLKESFHAQNSVSVLHAVHQAGGRTSYSWRMWKAAESLSGASSRSGAPAELPPDGLHSKTQKLQHFFYNHMDQGQ